MERLLIICLAGSIGIVFYYWFGQIVKKKAMRDFIIAHQWLMHPNAICYWRTAMALFCFFLYFWTSFQVTAIIIFTFAAILDGVDGVVARNCDLVSRLGESLDPLCDKLTYLPPMLGFAYKGSLSIELVWVLIGIELFGQFFARRLLTYLKISGAANNFGKIKAIICFGLVIFCALLDGDLGIIDISNQILLSCIVLAAASIVFKFVPNRLYADILSTLNFICGVTSLFLAYYGFFARAIIIIIVGQLFDLFDGRMAEKHGGTKFGPILDDIADFVSFGLAPSYIMIQIGGPFAWFFAIVYVAGVAYRLIRFVVVDKKRTDLPEGVFNGLPSPAGALVVLGSSLVVPAEYLWIVVFLTVVLMVSKVRFAHLGRVIIKKLPKPIFFSICAAVIVIIAFVLKTKNVELFGYFILTFVFLYILAGRKFHKVGKN
jgi:CDP-diacylglycerol---serine O-phosphatidyltransferase